MATSMLGQEPITLFLALSALALLPLLAVLVTSFAKISIVLNLTRNALGLQQVPPTIVLNAIALILTAYIMAPVVDAAYDPVSERLHGSHPFDFASVAEIAAEAKAPLVAFMGRHAHVHLIQKQGAFRCQLDAPHAGLHGARVCANSCAKEFAFHQGIGDAGAVHMHKISGHARLVMDDPGQRAFTGPGFTDDQHLGVAGACELQQLGGAGVVQNRRMKQVPASGCSLVRSRNRHRGKLHTRQRKSYTGTVTRCISAPRFATKRVF